MRSTHLANNNFATLFDSQSIEGAVGINQSSLELLYLTIDVIRQKNIQPINFIYLVALTNQ